MTAASRQSPSGNGRIEIDATSVRKINREGSSIAATVVGFEIKTEDQYVQAGEWLRHIAACLKRIEEICGEPKRLANALVKALRDQQKELEQPYRNADNWLRPRYLAFDQERRRKALLEAAEKQARIDKEVKRTAARLEKAGKRDLAAEYRESAALAPAIIPDEAPRVDGVSTRKYPRARVADFKALISAVARGEAPVECLLANQTYLNKQAEALGASLSIAGVEYYEESGLAVRR